MLRSAKIHKILYVNPVSPDLLAHVVRFMLELENEIYKPESMMILYLVVNLLMKTYVWKYQRPMKISIKYTISL